MKSILIYLFAGATAVIAYQSLSFLVRYLKSRSVHAFWGMSFAALTSLMVLTFILIYTAEPKQAAVAVTWGMLAGHAAFAAYIRCLEIYYNSHSRLLRLVSNAIFVIVGLYLCLLVIDITTSESLLTLERNPPLNFDSPMLPLSFSNYYDFTPVMKLMHASVRFLTVGALIYLAIFGNLRRDRVIQFGIFFSIFCMIHNTIAVSIAQAYFLPLIPFMNLIETTRFEWLARKGDLRRLSQYREKIASFDQGIKQHVKLKDIGKNTATVVHDAINIAMASDHYLGAIERGRNQEDARPDIEEIKATRRNNQRILDLLADFRQQRMLGNPEERIDFQSIFEDVRDLVQHRLDSQQIELSVSESPGRVVFCDRTKLAMVLVNLINNACDALSDEQTRWIRVVFTDQEGLLIISVVNSGSKISPAIQDDIFEPFYTTKAGLGGTGMGLKICRDYLHSMGGSIAINLENEYTQFDIALPALG